MRASTRPLLPLAIAALMSVPSWGADLVPTFGASLLGGQYFFAGQRGNLSADLAAHAAPIVKLGDGSYLLPLYSGSYRGTKDTTDPVAPGSLYSQETNNRLSFAYLRQIPDTTWKVKPSLSFDWDLLKETRDEAWGKGLFDNQTLDLGLEAENVYKDPFSYRVGYDVFWQRFPNYSSLESQAGTDPTGHPLGRQNAGTHTQDSVNQQVTFTVSRPVPYDQPWASVTLGYRLSWQKFYDQPLVNLAGQYVTQNRQDFTNALSASLVHPREILDGQARLAMGFGGSFQYTGSNQNNYDAAQTQFVPDAYSYWQISVGPNASVSWGDKKNPSTASAGFTWTRQKYFGLLAQTGSGLYTSDKERQDFYGFNMSYGYPVAPNFRLVAQANTLWADSNMNYEAYYKYTYTAVNFLFGFNYDY